jgi:hypothetical protein
MAISKIDISYFQALFVKSPGLGVLALMKKALPKAYIQSVNTIFANE